MLKYADKIIIIITRKKGKIEEETTGQIYNVRICYTGGHKQ